MPSPDYEWTVEIKTTSQKLGTFDASKEKTNSSTEENTIIIKIKEQTKKFWDSWGRITTSDIEKTNSTIYNTLKAKWYNSLQSLQQLSKIRETANTAVTEGKLNNFGKQVLLNAYIKDPSKALQLNISTDTLLTTIAIEKKFDYEHKTNELLSKYNLQYWANLTLSDLQSDITIGGEPKIWSSEEDIVLSQTIEWKEAIKTRKIEAFMKTVQSTFETKTSSPNLVRATIELLLKKTVKR